MNSPHRLFLALSLALLPCLSAQADIVINEILYDSEPNTRCNEFIELHNSGPDEVDISGWSFSDGINFNFPAETKIAAGGYMVIAQDPDSVLAQYNTTALGPWSGGLSNEGESIVLRDAAGSVVDEVDYNDTFPWPIGALSSGLSMELINPSLDNDLGSSWRANQPPPVLGELTYFSAGDFWSYRAGTSAPLADWNTPEFVEGADWVSGQTPIGFGSAGQVLATTLTDMQGSYTSIYTRHPFTVAPGETPQSLRLRHNVDDGFVAYLNGVEIARVRATGADEFDDLASAGQSPEGDWAELTVPAVAAVEGDNVLAIIAYNQTKGSSDFAFDFELVRPAIDAPLPVPTPGARNSAFASNAAPQIRQVDHSPKQPLTSEETVITAKVTDPDGVSSVDLEYQVVAPGDYIPAFLAKSHSNLLSNPNGPRDPNPAYHDVAWPSLIMRDDGTGGDAVAGDDIYSAILPAQSNRTLVRYRINVEDSLAKSIRVPYADDPSLNFAYYVYDGVPDYVADERSASGQLPYTHPKEVLESLPVYAMLTTQADFTQCVAYDNNLEIGGNNFDARSAFNWSATFVYDGVVYDHIGYRLRQRNARYSGNDGKRSFRFRFNDGNFIQLHDDNGDPYPTKWRTLNTHKMLGSRGGVNFGLYEAANSVLANLTGSPAPLTNWFHLRVVKTPEERPAGNNGQYLGDFYGLLIALQDYDVRFLETHKLERGNLYKLKTGGNDGLSVQRYQAKGAVDDASDFKTIINQLRNTQPDSWLRDHVDWQAYYKYKVIVDAVRTYDVSSGITPNNGEHLKNRSYYFRPDDSNPLGKMVLMPWDSDTSWGPNWNGGWDWPKSAMSDREEFNKEYKNVVREFRDLVWQPDQINPLLDSFQAKLEPFQLADRDRWTGATGTPDPGSQSDGPISARVAEMKQYAFDGGRTWDGGSSNNRDFVYNASGVIVANDSISRDDGVSGAEGRDAYLDALAFDPSIPNKPTISYTGAANYPTDRLSFQASAFDDPQGAATFAAMQWRVAEVAPPPGATANLLPSGANWNYLDDGSDQGSAWRAPGFDDSAWGTGPGPLGYGGITGLPGGSATTLIDRTGSDGNRYATAYFRTSLVIDDPENYQSFTLRMLVDDGAVVFVNGVEAVRDGFSATTVVGFDSLSDFGGNEGDYDEFEIASSFFVAGENSIAIELHNEALGSSDLGFDLTLDATPLPPGLLFEWNASWESGELATQQTQIDIPLSATREDRLYRARVRYKDDTERWSNWSDAHEFTTSLPDIQPLLDRLVISEIMYHPAAPTAAEISAGFTDSDQFEFIEIHNPDLSETLQLTGVRFTKGIDFDFLPGTTLPPGGYLLVVRNQAAFVLRYGAGLPIAGEYGTNPEGGLSNSGERLKLSFGGGTPIRDFVYDDKTPWPSAADGSGPSLELLAPETIPDHALAANWIASSAPGGSPGAAPTAGPSFTDFLASFGIADNNPDLDSDDNGLSNFLEFALAGDPTMASSPERPAAGTVEIAGADYLTITFRRPTNPSGISYALEFSTDLGSWAPGGVLMSSTPQADNTLAQTWRSNTPLPEDGKEFARLRVSQ